MSFEPFWRIGTGKYSAGIEVKNNLKFSLPWYYSLNDKTIFYSEGIQLLAKWQFVNRTQFPYPFALVISFSAFLPWPWPKEITESCFPLSNAYFSKDEVGSAPVERMKIIGVL